MSVYNDMNCNFPNRKGDRVLFHKVIFSTYDNAVNALKVKNLAPGEIAVARYYVDYNTDTIPPTWSAVRMVMAIGGATPHSGHDTYIFNDSVSSNDTDFITGSDLKSELSNYYSREEVDEIISNISVPEIDIENLATKDDISDVKSQIADASAAISDIRKTVDNKADASTVYTKEEANDVFAPSSVTEQISDISTKLEDKVDTSEINNIVEEAISNSDTVESAVQDAIDNADIDQKVSDAVENLDIVTKENLTTEVTTQIENNETIIELQTTVEKLVDASIYDGTELPEWDLEE